MAVPAPALRPSAGFCVQTESTGNPPARWYLNMCKHKMVEMPVSHSGKTVSRDHILTHGIGCLQVPFDMGSFRKLKERADGAKHTSYCIDVVFNPFIVALFMEDAFCNATESFRPFVINLALKRIEESVGAKLSSQKVKLVKSLRYKDPEDADSGLPREFAELPGETDSFDAELPRAPQAEAAAPEQPLIQDMTPGARRPAVKKGFLNSGKAQLYDERGSGEGVLPENAGDPMGWMPKGLRNRCNIVDCNSPEYQATEQKRKAAENSNKLNSDFRDTITKDMDKWARQAEKDKWEADLPDGTEQPSGCKYDVDYSRFNRIPDEDSSETKPEERDWYFDRNGNRQQVERPSEAAPAGATRSSQAATGADSGSQLQRGFLDKAKAPLYPKGSEQKAPPSEEELTRGMAELMKKTGGPEYDAEGAKELDRVLSSSASGAAAERQQQRPHASGTAVKAPSAKAADFTLTDVPEGLRLTVSVPGLTSMQGVSLDVTEREASLAFPSGVGLRPLKVALTTAVVKTAVRAKFSKRTQQIAVTLPVAVPGG